MLETHTSVEIKQSDVTVMCIISNVEYESILTAHIRLHVQKQLVCNLKNQINEFN